MESLKLTVTELTCACLDQKWQDQFLRGNRPSTRNLAPEGSAPVGGTAFHHIVAEFLTWLTTHPDATPISQADDLWLKLHDQFAAPIIRDLASDKKIETALNLSSALQTFCQQVASLRQACTHFTKWSDIFAAQEFKIPDVVFLQGAKTLILTGVIDGVRIHPLRGLEIVDYKLSRAANLHKDLTQLALYHYLISHLQTRTQFQACLEYYHPEFELLEIPPEELTNIFQSVVLPTARELAGVTTRSNLEATASQSSPSASEPDWSQEIKACFQSFGLDVEVCQRIVAPQITRYILQPASGVKVASLANRAEDLQVRLKLPQPPSIQPSSSGVTLDLPKITPDVVPWRKAIESCTGGPLQFPIGQGVDGRIVLADLSHPSTCHALIAGASGSGKSEWLKSFTATLMHRASPAQVRIALIDPKLLTFSTLSGSPHLLGPLMTTTSEALNFLTRAIPEMERRYQILAREHFSNLPERHAAGRQDLPFWVIIFDEFADLILAGREEKKEFENAVSRLAAKGRAAGIHLLLATQRPDRSIVTGLIKANLPMKICLRVTTNSNSQIVLDESGAERLVGRGDLLYDIGRGVHRAQGPFVSNEELARLVRGATVP